MLHESEFPDVIPEEKKPLEKPSSENSDDESDEE